MLNPSRREFLIKAGRAALVTGPYLIGLTAKGAAPAQPNILFLLPDEHRHDWIGSLGKVPALRTPALDALAAQGVSFNKCLCPAPLCGPSRACIASGREYDRCGVADNSADYPYATQPTFYQKLRDAGGYHVLGVGKFDLNKGEEIWGRDGKYHLAEWGFTDGIDNAGKPEATKATTSATQTPADPYMDYLQQQGWAGEHITDMQGRDGTEVFRNTAATVVPDAQYCDNWLTRNASDMLRAAPAGKPWFMQAGFIGPHYPLDITQAMKNSVKNLTYPQPHANTEYTTLMLNQIRQNYAAMIENIDARIKDLLDLLDELGQRDNTLIVFSSDHGEMLGDHNFWRKSVPYHASVGTPLIVAGPGVAGGRRLDALVSVMDLAATFLDYGGVVRPYDMDSWSIRNVLEGRWDTHRRYVFSGLHTADEGSSTTVYDWRMVYDGRYKYIDHFPNGSSGTEMLFDTSIDYEEDDNIAAANPETVKDLKSALAQMNGYVTSGARGSRWYE